MPEKMRSISAGDSASTTVRYTPGEFFRTAFMTSSATMEIAVWLRPMQTGPVAASL